MRRFGSVDVARGVVERKHTHDHGSRMRRRDHEREHARVAEEERREREEKERSGDTARYGKEGGSAALGIGTCGTRE